MRTLLLLPFALAACAVTGCGNGSDGTEQTAFQVPRRDLTLQETQAPKVEVASPVELARAPVQRRAAYRPQRARMAARTPRPAAVQPAPAAPAPAPARARTDSMSLASSVEPPDPHALAPGQSVTIIPASSGPPSEGSSSAPDWTDQRPGDGGHGPTIRGGGHGGRCGGRGTGGHPGGGGFRGLR